MRSSLAESLPLLSDNASPRYLGPANVVNGDSRAIRARLPNGEMVVAQLALALAYEPAEGDVVLLIGEASTYYGIGVLSGKGKLVLETAGDIAIRAGGALDLSADHVRVTGKEVEVASTKLTMVAEAFTQRVGALVQRVTGLFTVHAREIHTVAEESTVTQAKNATILSEDAVTINGKSVLLG